MSTKTEVQHTPGPWKVQRFNEKWEVVGQEYTVSNDFGDYVRPMVVTVMGGGERPFFHQTEANARLIAAAPELLEAAKSILVALDVNGCHEDAKILRAAIAKAEGK